MSDTVPDPIHVPERKTKELKVPIFDGHGYEKEVLDFLNDINGQDVYDADAVAVGYLETSEYLQMAVGYDVADNFIEIAAINTRAVQDASHKPIFGLLRAYAVMHGLLADEGIQPHVTRSEVNMAAAAATEDEKKIITSFVKANPVLAKRLGMFSGVLIMCISHVFRVTGHHYITGGDHAQMYSNLFRACLVTNLRNILPDDLLFYKVYHWIGPAEMVGYTAERIKIGTAPNAIVVRADAAPAGTALIATSAAVLSAMRQGGFSEHLEATVANEVRAVEAAARTVKQHPLRYHVSHQLFGKNPLESKELEEFAAGQEAAKKLAPMLQGFIDAIAQDIDLGRAKALRKHAEQSIFVHLKATTYFRSVRRGLRLTTTFASIFNAGVAVDADIQAH